MSVKRGIIVISLVIALLSSIAAAIGIFSGGGQGPYEITSVRGEKVTIYGKGMYQHMSAEVAPQGIAQDVVTLFIGVPLLLLGLWWYSRDRVRGKILLTGTLGYFLVTYGFFTLMAMYNQLFILWVVLLSLSFFGFLLAFSSIDKDSIAAYFSEKLPTRAIGSFLIFNACAIAFLWLSIVVPPAINGTIPKEVEHYTTLVVQALDLSILLPASFIAGWLIYKRKAMGYALAPVYLVFLTFLMTALTAKIIAMSMLGYNVIPAIFIIPAFNLITLLLTISVFKSIRTLEY